MTNTTRQEWLVDDDLVYRLENGSNHDEITVTMVNGSRSVHERKARAKQIMFILNSIPDLLDALCIADAGYDNDNLPKIIENLRKMNKSNN